VIIVPESHDDSGSLDLPSGMRLLLAGVEMLRLSRRGDSHEPLDDDEPNPDKDERDHD
jgi:hypothetical protein